MKKTTQIFSAYAFFLFFAFIEPAYAYLDPGTGSIILQGLVAAVAGIVVSGKLYWNKIKSAFSFKKKKVEKQPQKEEE